MTEKATTYYPDGRVVEREIVRYVDIAAACCVIRVHGYDDADPKESWRWINIDLVSTHDRLLPWRKRLGYAWWTLRHGTASREFIEIIRPEEADHLIDAMQQARSVAFGPTERLCEHGNIIGLGICPYCEPEKALDAAYRNTRSVTLEGE